MTGRGRRESGDVRGWVRAQSSGVQVVCEGFDGAEVQSVALDEAKGEKEHVIYPEEL